MDASRRASADSRTSMPRCNAAGGRQAPRLHDPGVEGRVQARHPAGRSAGLEMAIAGSPGWSESGGPWVPGSEGMKKYVWSETVVEGGTAVQRNSAASAVEHRRLPERGHSRSQPTPGAAPIPTSTRTRSWSPTSGRPCDKSVEELHAKITASGGSTDFAMLTDGDLEKTTSFPFPPTGDLVDPVRIPPAPGDSRHHALSPKIRTWIAAHASRESACPTKSSRPATTARIFAKWPSSMATSDPPEHTVSFRAGDRKVFPRHVQADAAAAASSLGRRTSIRVLRHQAPAQAH